MRIQHNILSMNAYRNYTNNTSALGKNLEKLSSGYKINRAGDDAAGLAISEKMRAQIKGLEAAQKNVKDATSLIKTAEGAMQEIQDMLSRMKYLATQSANGTYDSAVDRDNLQKEVDSLLEEIDRIADNANFNEIKLLDGTFGSGAANNNNAVSAPEATLDTTNAAKLGAVKVAFADDATDEEKKALSDALKGDFKFKTTDEGDNNWGAGDKIQIDKIPTGYTLKTKAQDGTTDITIAAATDLETGTGNSKIDASKDLAIDVYKGTKKVGTITIGKPTAGASGETTVTFKEPAPAAATAAAAGGTDANQAAGGTATFKQADLAGMITTGTEGLKISGLTDKVKKVALKTDAAPATTADGAAAAAFDKASGVLTITLTPKGTGGGTPSEVDADGIAAAIKAATGAADAGDLSKVKVEGTITAVTASQTTAKSADVEAATDPNGNTNAAGNGGQFQIGDSAGEILKVSISDMHTSGGMGVSGLKGTGIMDITSANAAIDTIKNAINFVSGVRGQLGAWQNRLDHTANNLSVMTENITDAESGIRDTDVADEMMAYTKNNILIQSAQAMLAQANAVPQGVLQLLQ